jgi:integrase
MGIVLRCIFGSIILFSLITGWRIRSEVLTLQWRQIDFQAGRVMLEPGTTKNDEGRPFAFTHELRNLLQKQHAVTQALQQEKGS